MTQPRVGGSFAPPLDRDTLARYRKLAEGAGRKVGSRMLALCGLAEAHAERPRSKKRGSAHPSGKGVVVELEAAVKEELSAHLPDDDELILIAERFDAIDPRRDKELRDAAFHLLWFANELARGREPMTTDRLEG